MFAIHLVQRLYPWQLVPCNDVFWCCVSLCSKLINCSICDCFVNPNDADVILTAHNMEASLWPLQCPECFLGSLYIMTASAHGIASDHCDHPNDAFPSLLSPVSQLLGTAHSNGARDHDHDHWKSCGNDGGSKKTIATFKHSFPNMIFLDWQYKIWRICLIDRDRCLRKIWKEREIHLAGRTVAAAHSHLTLLKHNCKDCI